MTKDLLETRPAVVSPSGGASTRLVPFERRVTLPASERPSVVPAAMAPTTTLLLATFLASVILAPAHPAYAAGPAGAASSRADRLGHMVLSVSRWRSRPFA